LKFSRFWILIFLSVSTYIKPEHSKKTPGLQQQDYA
jgi:hypothetical protein